MSDSQRVVFMGTPQFARTILEELIRSKHEVVGVVAQPDKPVGRGKKMQSPPVAVCATENQIPLFQPPKIKGSSLLDDLKAMAPDFIVVAAYGKILPGELLEIPKRECLNVHVSLLPKYRGAAPINYAILQGEEETGVSIMRVVPELDAGPVFFRKPFAICDDDDALTLTERMAREGGVALLKTIDEIVSENLQPVDQQHDMATFAPKMTKEMGHLDWSKPAKHLWNQVRGLLPWPVAETQWEGKRLRVFRAQLTGSHSGKVPGTIVHMGGEGWTISTGDGDLLLKEVQLEGKKRMPANALANGIQIDVGAKLGDI